MSVDLSDNIINDLIDKFTISIKDHYKQKIWCSKNGIRIILPENIFIVRKVYGDKVFELEWPIPEDDDYTGNSIMSINIKDLKTYKFGCPIIKQYKFLVDRLKAVCSDNTELKTIIKRQRQKQI